jgi:hypothetical protein
MCVQSCAAPWNLAHTCAWFGFQMLSEFACWSLLVACKIGELGCSRAAGCAPFCTLRWRLVCRAPDRPGWKGRATVVHCQSRTTVVSGLCVKFASGLRQCRCPPPSYGQPSSLPQDSRCRLARATCCTSAANCRLARATCCASGAVSLLGLEVEDCEEDKQGCASWGCTHSAWVWVVCSGTIHTLPGSIVLA